VARVARCAAKPAPYSPNRDSLIAGDNLALIIEDEVTGERRWLRPGFECHRRSVMARHAIRRLCAAWTARSGPMMK